MYKNLRDLFEANKGAIGAFNLHCLEMLPYIIKGAEEAKRPVIIQTSLGTAEYIGIDLLVNNVKFLAKTSSVDICLHMDHCKDIEALKNCIKKGYSSVMYDGSNLDIDKNILNTKEIVKFASDYDVSVEAEIGCIGGTEDGEVFENSDKIYTDVDEALRFYKETKVDALAVAIGTAHGQYKSKARINYDLLSELKEKLNTNLVLHGGTGVSDDDMKKCVEFGIKKINVGTELNKGYIDEINSNFPKAKPTTSMRNLLMPGNNKIQSIVNVKSNLFKG